MARSRPPGEEPWQTFRVTVRVVRGRAEVYAAVELSAVTGVVGATHVRPRPLYQGVIGRREASVPVTPEVAATWAHEALQRAFPTLF